MFAVTTNGSIETTSRIKAFVLSTFYGHNIVSRWYRPLFGCAIFTIYVCRFELLPANTIV